MCSRLYFRACVPAQDEGSSSQPDDMEFHPWTVAHTQWVTAPSRTKPVKLLMLMPPLGSEFEIPFSYRHFGKHMHVRYAAVSTRSWCRVLCVCVCVCACVCV